MARRRQDHWTRRVSRSRLAAIHAALDQGESAAVVYGRFRVAQAGVTLRCFQAYSRERRVGLAPLGDADLAAAQAPAATVDDAIAATIDAMTLALRGQPTLAQSSMALSALVAERKRQEAEERGRLATELLAAKVAGIKAELRRGVEQRSESGAKALTREDVYDLVDQVMRGS